MLYHADIYIPTPAQSPCFQGRLIYGHHARSAAQSDRYGAFELPTHFEASSARLIEVELDARGRVLKQVWRTPLSSEKDLVLVLQPDGFVRTVWINLATDAHRTLDRSRYQQAPRKRG